MYRVIAYLLPTQYYYRNYCTRFICVGIPIVSYNTVAGTTMADQACYCFAAQNRSPASYKADYVYIGVIEVSKAKLCALNRIFPLKLSALHWAEFSQNYLRTPYIVSGSSCANFSIPAIFVVVPDTTGADMPLKIEWKPLLYARSQRAPAVIILVRKWRGRRFISGIIRAAALRAECEVRLQSVLFIRFNAVSQSGFGLSASTLFRIFARTWLVLQMTCG